MAALVHSPVAYLGSNPLAERNNVMFQLVDQGNGKALYYYKGHHSATITSWEITSFQSWETGQGND